MCSIACNGDVRSVVCLVVRPGACSTTHRSNRPDHWNGVMLDRSAVGQLSSLSSGTKWQRLPAGHTLRSVSPAGNRCHFVLLHNDESCPTADLSSIGYPNSPVYSTGELLNMPLMSVLCQHQLVGMASWTGRRTARCPCGRVHSYVNMHSSAFSSGSAWRFGVVDFRRRQESNFNTKSVIKRPNLSKGRLMAARSSTCYSVCCLNK